MVCEESITTMWDLKEFHRAANKHLRHLGGKGEISPGNCEAFLHQGFDPVEAAEFIMAVTHRT